MSLKHVWWALIILGLVGLSLWAIAEIARGPFPNPHLLSLAAREGR